MGNIGTERREVEFEPLTSPSIPSPQPAREHPAPAQQPAPSAPSAPSADPAEVPAGP